MTLFHKNIRASDDDSINFFTIIVLKFVLFSLSEKSNDLWIAKYRYH